MPAEFFQPDILKMDKKNSTQRRSRKLRLSICHEDRLLSMNYGACNPETSF
ncbi:MAG TPA: hypothetical protein VGT04_16365 [Acidobacteriaceae bacterium]|nr:hypothetical protein [Acidobacteriaceae bacterium]